MFYKPIILSKHEFIANMGEITFERKLYRDGTMK